jgi:hypothetical protein
VSTVILPRPPRWQAGESIPDGYNVLHIWGIDYLIPPGRIPIYYGLDISVANVDSREKGRIRCLVTGNVRIKNYRKITTGFSVSIRIDDFHPQWIFRKESSSLKNEYLTFLARLALWRYQRADCTGNEGNGANACMEDMMQKRHFDSCRIRQCFPVKIDAKELLLSSS